MPARDLYHDTVRKALTRDGWTITDDPLKLPWGFRDSFVDLGAEKLLAAEKGKRKIAVEIKSFTSPSLVYDLERAIGQFVLYRALLDKKEPDRTLYLAIPEPVLKDIYLEQMADVLIGGKLVQMFSFDPAKEVIARWT